MDDGFDHAIEICEDLVVPEPKGQKSRSRQSLIALPVTAKTVLEAVLLAIDFDGELRW